MPLKLTKRHGSRTWYIRGTVRGQSIDESTKTDSREAAEAIRIKRENELLNNSIFGARATVTFMQAAVSHMEAGGDATFMQPLIDHFNDKLLFNIQQADIDEAARKLYPHWKPSSWDRAVYAPMSAVLKHGNRNKWCDYIQVVKPRYKNARIRWETPEGALKLVKNCAPHLARLVTFLFGSGARLSEALYLSWADVDLKAGKVTFNDTKNGETRVVPISQRAIQALEQTPKDRRVGRVFLTHRGKPYKRIEGAGGQIKSGFKRACERAGIDDFSPHDCRHTWATWHYQTNKDVAQLMLLGGWKSASMVMRYAHADVSRLAEGVKAMGW